MVSTEMSRYALPANGVVEHTPEAGSVTVVHAKSDEAAGELVHNEEHPVALDHDGLTAKQIDAPQTVGGVADER